MLVKVRMGEAPQWNECGCRTATNRPEPVDEPAEQDGKAGAAPGRAGLSGTECVLPGPAFHEHDGEMNRRDYCPIAASVEVLGDRWTPLIIRELMVGAGGFNEIHRGIPRVSRTLLAQRLRELERRGLMTHARSRPGHPGVYALTAAGQALTPIVWAMGAWAAEWMFGDPSDEHCDGLTLIWRTHQVVIPAKLPESRTVVHVVLTGAGGAQGWLDIQRPGITVCKDDQGLPVDLAVEADTAQMHRWLVGLVPFRDLVANGHARFLGPSRLAKAFPTWFDTSLFSHALRRAQQRQVADAVPA
jgi:DNA-binding HxlR family transcriptional regulator